MRPFTTILVSAIVAIIASYMTVKTLAPTADGAPSQKASNESAYDRVIASGELVCGLIPWAPYKIYDPNTGEWSGFAVDYYRKAFATLDINVVFKEVVLGNQIQDLNTGRIDAMCDDGPWTMSAGKFVEYSDTIYGSKVYPYVRKNDDRFQKRSDLNAQSVRFVGIDGDLSVDLVQRLFPEATLATLPGTADVSQLYINVETGKADVTIADSASFDTYALNNENKLDQMTFDNKPLGVYKQVIGVRKGDFKMLSFVNQAIDNAQSFGITDDVLDGFDPEHQIIARVRSKYQDKSE